MALQTLPAGLWIPPRPFHSSGTTPALTFLGALTAATHRVAVIGQAPRTGNLRTIHWGTRTVTTGTTLAVDVQTVDLSTGFPSGTLWAVNTTAATVVNSGDDNAILTSTLTADAAVTRGDLIAIVWNNSGAGNLQLPTSTAFGSNLQGHFPYGASYNGASWTANITGYMPMIVLTYDDGTVVGMPPLYPPCTTLTTTATLSTSSTPDVVGLRFSLPFPARIVGAWVAVDLDGDADVRLVTTAYNQGTQAGVLATVSLDATVRRATTAGIHELYFATAVTVSANTVYRLIIEPTTATTLGGVYDLNVASLAQLNAVPGLPSGCFTTAKDPTQDSDWTNFNSGTFRYPLMGLLVDAFDDGASGGAGLSWAPLSIVTAAGVSLIRSIASGGSPGRG